MCRLARFFGALLLAAVVPAADWPQFRGPNTGGVAHGGRPPEKWGPDENVRWKAALPGRGVSSPVVVGDRIYLTACSGLDQTRLHVLCFDAAKGGRVWERQFWATGPTNCNPKTCMAAPTPVADREHVFATFGTGDVVCLNTPGEVCWLRCLQFDEPAMTNLVGRGASPVLHDDVLVVPMESQGASFLFGIDARTGGNRWKAERPTENSYTTPVVVRDGGGANLIAQSGGGLAGYDPATGARRWQFDDAGASSIASPIVLDGLVLAAGREMVALRPASDGPPEVVWRSTRLAASTPTPLAAARQIYVLKDNGVLACGDVRTGKELWTLRLRGSYSASPVLADNRLYLLNEDGDTTVVRVADGDPPDRVAVNTLHDLMLATPAVAGDCLFLRSDGWLYCVGPAASRK